MIEIKDSGALAAYLTGQTKKTETPELQSGGEESLSVTVCYLRAQNGGEEVSVGVELSDAARGLTEKRSYVLLIEIYAGLSLHRGAISREKLLEIEQAAELSAALRRGAGILGYGANSGQALRQKLRRRGFSNETTERAVAMLSEKGYLREGDDARRETERSLAKGWGRRRILAYLRQRGYEGEAIRGAEDTLAGEDFAARCAAVARKKSKFPPADADERRKLQAFLIRYGYDMSEIREALRMAWMDDTPADR